jgi:hypothetical protein
LRRCIRSDVQVWRGRGLRACSVSPYRWLKVPTSRAPVAECLRPRDDAAHPHSNAAEHGSRDRPQAACAVTAGALSIRPAADMRSVVPTLHRTASCFKLGFPGVRELRPSQQAPGIAVRVSLRRRERSSDVPCSEPPLQGSPRPSMPRSRIAAQGTSGACIAWRVARALHAHAGV